MSNVVIPKSHNLSSYPIDLSLTINLVARHCTSSNRLMSFCRHGFHTSIQYSNFSCTKLLYKLNIRLFIYRHKVVLLIKPNVLLADFTTSIHRHVAFSERGTITPKSFSSSAPFIIFGPKLYMHLLSSLIQPKCTPLHNFTSIVKSISQSHDHWYKFLRSFWSWSMSSVQDTTTTQHL